MKKSFVTKPDFKTRMWKFGLKLLGFASVSMYISCTKYGAPVPEYGIPTNDIIFKGMVSSADSLKPIQNIQVKINNVYGNSVSGVSDNLGNYTLVENVNISDSVTLEFKDVDGSNHGSFKDTIIGNKISENDFNTGMHTENIQLNRKP
jgi:putative lipoprotein (rSAM/lipoprotein system)